MEQEGLKKRESQIASELEKLFEMQMSAKGIAQDLFQERLAKVGGDRKAVQARLMELSAQIEDVRAKGQESERIRDRILEFKKGWKKATGSDKKRLSRRVLSRLIPTERGLEVFYFSERTAGGDLIGSCVGSDIGGNGWGGRTRTCE